MAQEKIDPSLFSEDIREFMTLLDRHRVRWLLVGGHAAIFHGHVRVTGDTDIFYDREPENCARLFRALKEFWGGNIPEVADASELEEPDTIIQFGRPPNRLDLISTADGTTFEDAFASREVGVLEIGRDRVPIPVIGREVFLRNKRASGRPKDLEDIRSLEE